MVNKDIHEWLLDEGIDSLTTIVNVKGESIFLVDVLEKHLKEQFLQTTVISSACSDYVEGINMQWRVNNENKFKKMNNVKNKLRVMHYAQVPCKPFIVDVSNEREAKKIMDVLADQHLFLLEQNIIPDYSNDILVVMWDENADGEGNADWVDYWNDEEGMDFDEFSETYLSNEVVS